MNLPDSLSRKAIARTFDRLTPVAWEKLFEREDQNGLEKLRVDGDYPAKAYYETDGILKWLVRNGHYTHDELTRKLEPRPAPTATVRTHLLAG